MLTLVAVTRSIFNVSLLFFSSLMSVMTEDRPAQSYPLWGAFLYDTQKGNLGKARVRCITEAGMLS